MKISELPEEIKIKAIKYRGKNDSDDLSDAFAWDCTLEGEVFWHNLHNKKAIKTESLIYTFANEIKEEYPEVIIKTPEYYDNSKGSLYKFCQEKELNNYEFDIIKRVMRCRKKGLFKEDLEKTKNLIDLYLKEYEK